jgi:hypothetical protein
MELGLCDKIILQSYLLNFFLGRLKLKTLRMLRHQQRFQETIVVDRVAVTVSRSDDD